MTINFQHDNSKTVFTVTLSSGQALEEGGHDVLDPTDDNIPTDYLNYAVANGFNPTDDLLAILTLSHKSGVNETGFSFSSPGVKNCGSQSGCKGLFAVVYQSVPGNNAILGHDRSGSRVKDDQGGGYEEK